MKPLKKMFAKAKVIVSKAKAPAVAVSTLAVTSIASAAKAEPAKVVDTSAIVDALTGLTTPIAAVGGAYLTVLVAMTGWKLLRGMF